MRSVLFAKCSEKFCADTIVAVTAQISVNIKCLILLLLFCGAGREFIAYTLDGDNMLLANLLA